MSFPPRTAPFHSSIVEETDTWLDELLEGGEGEYMFQVTFPAKVSLMNKAHAKCAVIPWGKKHTYEFNVTWDL